MIQFVVNVRAGVRTTGRRRLPKTSCHPPTISAAAASKDSLQVEMSSYWIPMTNVHASLPQNQFPFIMKGETSSTKIINCSISCISLM